MRSSSRQSRSLDGLSSPDALANSSTDRFAVDARSPSPAKRRLSSPAKSDRSKRDRRSVSTPLSVNSIAAYPISPSRTVTEQTLSPWKIRVTVEAEREGDEEAGQTLTRTIKVPLRGDTSPINADSASEVTTSRGRRSTPTTAKTKRNGTPVRRRSGSRTRSRRPSVTDLNIAPLGDDGDSDEWTLKKRSPRKRKTSRSQRAQSEPSNDTPQASEEEVAPASNDQMSQASQITEDEPFSIHGDANLSVEASVAVEATSRSPELRQIDLSRVEVRPRPQSTKRRDGPNDPGERSHGKHTSGSRPGMAINTTRKASANSAASYPTPSPTSSYHHSDELSKDAESTQEHEKFDTMLESEGFTMIDLDSIPSARQFLSSPDDQTTESQKASRLQEDGVVVSSKIPTSKALPLPLSNKKLTTIPSYLALADDESDLSSNVPSSPPVRLKGMLDVPSHNIKNADRKVTPQAYSSPSLPPPPRSQKATSIQNSPDSLPKQVLNAGLALQDVVGSPNDGNEQSTQSLCSRSSSSQPADAFDGFSSGTKRELRAGLRFGEELAKRQRSSTLSSGAAIKKTRPADVDSADSAIVSTGQSQITTQFWRGETIVRHSPFASDMKTQTKVHNHNHAAAETKEAGSLLSSETTSARRTSRITNSNTQMLKTARTDLDVAQLHPSVRDRHDWQLEREAVSREIENASPSEVVVINSDSDGEAYVVGRNTAGLGCEDSTDGKQRTKRARNDSMERGDLARPSQEAAQQDDDIAAQEIESREKRSPYQGATSGVEDDERGKRRTKRIGPPSQSPADHSDEEEDIWLQTAKDSSSSPPHDTATSEELFTRTEQRRQAERAAEVLNKPRRSLIPSPWKRGQDLGEASTLMSNGDMSGLLWQEGRKEDRSRFGAGEIARQRQQHQRVERKAGLDLKTMLESPVRRAVAGEDRVLRMIEDEEQEDSVENGDESEGEEVSQADTSDDPESVGELEDASAATSTPSSASSVETPRAQTIPVNFNDSTLSTTESTTAEGSKAMPATPPPSRSPPRDDRPHSARATRQSFTPPRSAIKGARLSYSPVKIEGARSDADDMGERRVVFSQRSMYLNEEGGESSMSAILDSPAIEADTRLGENKLKGEGLGDEMAVELENGVDGKRDQGGWLGWMLRGKSPDQSQIESDLRQSEDVAVAKYDGTNEDGAASRVVDEKPNERGDGGDWEAAKTSLATTNTTRGKRSIQQRQSNSSKNQSSNAPQPQCTPQPDTHLSSAHSSKSRSQPQDSQPKTSVSKPTPSPRLPSYLLPPSYPSLPNRDTSVPLPVSGDFSNTHFGTLHIIHAKSLRPRFHAPPRLRDSVGKLVREGWTLTRDETGRRSGNANGREGKDGKKGQKTPDLGVFEWTVGRNEGEVLERFMQEVELGYGVAPRDCHGRRGEGEDDVDDRKLQEEVQWGWTTEFLAEMLGMIVIGEEVRREEGMA